MTGRKESTIGVLSSDRCPCCAFSSHCEQALGRHPHKTWKDLTCVQNSSTELQAHSRSLKQTWTHAGTTLCRHTIHTHKQAFPSGYKAYAWKKWTPGARIRGLAYWMYCLGSVMLLYVKGGRKHSQLYLCCRSAGKENRWAAIDLIAWQTSLPPRSATVRRVCQRESMVNSVSQLCYQVGIVFVW